MNSVVTAINTALAPLGAVVYGISTPIIVEDKDENRSIVPAIIDDQGECIYVDPEDSNKLTIYHRVYSSQYPPASRGFGDGNEVAITYDMALVCFGLRLKVGQAPDAVERSIVSLIPKNINGKKIIVSSTDFDQNRIFASEFQNVKSFIDPRLFLFMIKYKVTITYNSAKCLNN